MNINLQKITIITSTRNCATSFNKTCESIRLQNYKAMQWIVIDGKSNDGTVDIINLNSDIISYWITEPDSGIYDAWNKACFHIKGEWVLFFGAGDIFPEPDTLKKVNAALAGLPDSITIAYGNVYQAMGDRAIEMSKEVNFGLWNQYRPALPAHQGVFHRSLAFNGLNTFDSSYKVVGDSKFLLQIINNNNTFYINIDVCNMEPGGISSNPLHVIKVMNEFFRLEKELEYRIPKHLRDWYRIKTYVKFLIVKSIGVVAYSSLMNIIRRINRYKVIFIKKLNINF